MLPLACLVGLRLTEQDYAFDDSFRPRIRTMAENSCEGTRRELENGHRLTVHKHLESPNDRRLLRSGPSLGRGV